MGAAQDKPFRVNKFKDSETFKCGNISNMLCCSEYSSFCKLPDDNKGLVAEYKEWDKCMRGNVKARGSKSKPWFGPSSTPASERVKLGEAAESSSAPESKGPRTSDAGTTRLRSYSPSASYFIPASAPTQGWDAEGQAQLEWAVLQAARETKVRPPGYRAMQMIKLEIARGHRPSIYNDRSIHLDVPCQCFWI
jgi:hypothetical protein